MVSARVGTLEDEVTTLKGMIRERDEVLRAVEKAHEELRDEVMGWQTHAEGKLFVTF
jgi:hypothetical protein